MNKNLLKKIGRYSSIAGATALATTANAGIVYTNIDPDSTLVSAGDWESMTFDFNNDSQYDFSAWQHKATSSTDYSAVYFAGGYEGYGTAGAYRYGDIVLDGGGRPALMNASEAISSNNSSIGYSGYVGRFFPNSSTGSGNYSGTIDKYVGVHFWVNGDNHYGWARVDIDTLLTSVTIKDIAYETTPGDSILAGHVQPIGTTMNVAGTDNSDNGNASDLTVSFDALTDETYITEYRLMAVKAASAASFDLSTAEAIASGNYQAVTPSGANFSQALALTFKDSDGATLVAGDNYQFFVLAMSSYPDQTILVNAGNTLSAASTDVMFNAFDGISELANQFIITNNKNNISISGNGNKMSSVILVDMNGKTVINSNPNSNNDNINISDLNSGMYILSIETNKGSFSKKIVK